MNTLLSAGTSSSLMFACKTLFFSSVFVTSEYSAFWNQLLHLQKCYVAFLASSSVLHCCKCNCFPKKLLWKLTVPSLNDVTVTDRLSDSLDVKIFLFSVLYLQMLKSDCRILSLDEVHLISENKLIFPYYIQLFCFWRINWNKVRAKTCMRNTDTFCLFLNQNTSH